MPIFKSSYLLKVSFFLDSIPLVKYQHEKIQSNHLCITCNYLPSILWVCLIPEGCELFSRLDGSPFLSCFQLFLIIPPAPLKSGTDDNKDGENLLSYITRSSSQCILWKIFAIIFSSCYLFKRNTVEGVSYWIVFSV